MKKTIIVLMALAGAASAVEYNYTGATEGWAETKANWTNTETNEQLATNNDHFGQGGTNASQITNGNTFNINSGVTVKAGKNTGGFRGATINVSNSSTLQTNTSGGLSTPNTINVTTGATLNIQSGATVASGNINVTGANLKVGGTVTGANVTLTSATVEVEGGSLTINKNVNGSTINVTSGTLTFGNDVKMKNVTVTADNTVLFAANAKAYWDNNSNNGPITFNLKDNGKVAYNDIYFKTAGGADQPGWGGSLTLSANCSVGLLEGSGLILQTRDLVTFNSLNNNATYGSKEALLANYINGGSITLNGVELTYSATGFDGASLNAEDVGKYTFTLTDNAIQLQYVAYSQAATAPETPAIPEPATATLSLLALCGLAARRRRK